ncbi:MAG: hypothetical protein HZB91_11910 [Elusimicrobia bacterium]|nr:hypothetical protein [Elusimicrobiota bacterium]
MNGIAVKPAPPLPRVPLEKFELTVVRSPRPAAPIEPGKDSVLVESGSFRVDVSRLLDKLSEHQLTDPRDFILCWLRCAVASGARRVKLDPTPDGLELRFNGKSFSAGELDNPYAALLDADTPESRRGRHFAYGLLGVQRLEPDRVEVISGPRNNRAVLVMEGKATAQKQGTVMGVPWRTEPQPSEGTAIRLHWRVSAGRREVPGLLARASDAFGLADLELTVDGRPIPSHPWEAPSRKATGKWAEVSKDGWRGAVCHFIPAPQKLPTATIHLYVLGTLMDNITRHQYSAFEAYLARDDLALDISQTKVVENEKLEQGIRTLL